MLEHRGRAMENVRALLNERDHCLSEALLVAIVALSTIEAALGNMAAYRSHLSALKLLRKEKGRVKVACGRNVADMIALYSDTVQALRTGKSAFGRRQYEATFVHQPPSPKVQLVPGFAALLTQMPLSQDTVDVLVNACNLGLGVPCVTLSDSQRMALAGRRQTLRKYHSYLDSVPILLMPDDSDDEFEKMLILALSLFAWYGFTTIRSPQFGIHQATISKLSKRLLQFQPDGDIVRKCTAWMWIMLIDAWRIGGSDGAVLSPGLDMLWHFHHRFSEYRMWHELQGLTRLFFWTGDMEMFWQSRWTRLLAEVLVTNQT